MPILWGWGGDIKIIIALPHALGLRFHKSLGARRMHLVWGYTHYMHITDGIIPTQSSLALGM